MGYSMESLQDDCYENTSVLVNKLDIRDAETLNAVEETYFIVNSTKIEAEHNFRAVDFEYYKNLHKRLFEDLYDWAGQIRGIDIGKKGTRFCGRTEIAALGEACFNRLREKRGKPPCGCFRRLWPKTEQRWFCRSDETQDTRLTFLVWTAIY
jgi:cell filamentation protein